jgi:hypothetical protein
MPLAVSTLLMSAWDATDLVVHVAVAHHEGLVRVSLLLDGELVDGRLDVPSACELRVAWIPGGRHVLTVRAIDTAGRWGAASCIVEGADVTTPAVGLEAESVAR